MTIDKAIEILESAAAQEHLLYFPYLKEAGQLGIEAIKRIKEQRDHPPTADYSALPGETEE